MIKFDINFNLKEAKTFADLSGDFNPMHLDENYSRRLIYGEPVAHGINVVFKILENRLGILAKKILVKDLKIKFLEPIYYGVKYNCTIVKVGEIENITLSFNQKKIISISISYDINAKFNNIVSNNNSFEKVAPIFLLIEKVNYYHQTIKYEINSDLFKLNYPKTYEFIELKLINFLISTSYIVGMKIPGLNSIYSQIELSKSNVINYDIGDISINIHKTYKSVNLIKLDISDNSFFARINCFFRPPPISQPKIKNLANIVIKDEFKSQDVLIIGGSRGLGELTSKIIALGGGKVTITYSSGLLEATKIKNEIFEFNQSNITIEKLNINDNNFTYLSNRFSHIYYFPTPKIKKSISDIFDDSLYRKYFNYYVTGFNKILDFCSKNNDCKIFYPSTIFIEQNENHFKEYIRAKIDGEKLIDEFDQKKIKIFKPRLPKLDTDQTASLIYEEKSDIISIMYKTIKQFSNYE